MKYRSCPLCDGEVRANIGPGPSGADEYAVECTSCGYEPAPGRPRVSRSGVRELVENVRLLTPEQLDELSAPRLRRIYRRPGGAPPVPAGLKIED